MNVGDQNRELRELALMDVATAGKRVQWSKRPNDTA